MPNFGGDLGAPKWCQITTQHALSKFEIFVDKNSNFLKCIIGKQIPNLGGDMGGLIGHQITPQISRPIKI